MKKSVIGIAALSLVVLTVAKPLHGQGLRENLAVGAHIWFAEPWGDPGTGAFFGPGPGLKLSAQYELTDIVGSLYGELMLGFESYSGKDGPFSEGSATVIPIQVNGLYDVTDLLPITLPLEFAIFGFGGLGLNFHSWDWGKGAIEIEGQTSVAFTFGGGAHFTINDQIKATGRLSWQPFASTSTLKKADGSDLYDDPDLKDYAHGATGILLGVLYKL